MKEGGVNRGCEQSLVSQLFPPLCPTGTLNDAAVSSRDRQARGGVGDR